MAITRQIQTPLRHAKVKKRIVITYGDSVGIAATLDPTAYPPSGTAFGAASGAVLYDRWFFRAYASSGSPSVQRNVSQWNTVLPGDYIPGSDIGISLVYTSTNTSGTMNWVVGLSTLSAGNLIGDEAETTYQTISAPAGGTTTFDSELSSVSTFSGTGLVAGEPLGILVYRDDTVDGMASDCYLQQVYVDYYAYSYPADDSVQKYKMTPVKFKQVTKTMSVPLFQCTVDPGTFNGVVCTASALSQDQYRIIGWRGDQTANEVLQFTQRMPEDFISGSAIDIVIKYYGEASTAGNMVLACGLCSDVMGNTFGDETDTTYVSSTVAFNGTRDVEQETTFNFTKSINAGDPISVIIYRHGANASDTYDADINITGISVRYKGEAHGSNI